MTKNDLPINYIILMCNNQYHTNILLKNDIVSMYYKLYDVYHSYYIICMGFPIKTS